MHRHAPSENVFFISTCTHAVVNKEYKVRILLFCNDSVLFSASLVHLSGKLWPRMYKVKLHEGNDDGEQGPESSPNSGSERT